LITGILQFEEQADGAASQKENKKKRKKSISELGFYRRSLLRNNGKVVKWDEFFVIIVQLSLQVGHDDLRYRGKRVSFILC
jgi:hypothetical protein